MRELATAKRPLVIGVGGGGDVVGALAVAEHCRLFHGANPIVGGVTWERSVVDPEPGPRRSDEIEHGLEIAPGVLAASGETVIRSSGVRFAESRVAGMLGVQTVLVDVNIGPAAIADGLQAAVEAMGCDLVVFLDVGGDALAHGDEPGLETVPTEASAQAVRAFRGVSGDVPIRDGRRTVRLSPLSAVTFFFLVP